MACMCVSGRFMCTLNDQIWQLTVCYGPSVTLSSNQRTVWFPSFSLITINLGAFFQVLSFGKGPLAWPPCQIDNYATELWQNPLQHVENLAMHYSLQRWIASAQPSMMTSLSRRTCYWSEQICIIYFTWPRVIPCFSAGIGLECGLRVGFPTLTY